MGSLGSASVERIKLITPVKLSVFIFHSSLVSFITCPARQKIERLMWPFKGRKWSFEMCKPIFLRAKFDFENVTCSEASKLHFIDKTLYNKSKNCKSSLLNWSFPFWLCFLVITPFLWLPLQITYKITRPSSSMSHTRYIWKRSLYQIWSFFQISAHIVRTCPVRKKWF